MVIALGAIYILCVSGLLQNCSESTSKASAKSENYLGDLACQNCHQQEFEDWSGSDHDKAMQNAGEGSILGNFNDVTYSNNGVTSRFFRKEDKYMVNTEGPDGQNEDFEVKYTFGVEPLQQYLIQFPGGRLQCLLVAWDSDKGEWYDLMPEDKLQNDDWLHWTKGSMTWNTMCADCHSTDLKKNFDHESNTYNTEWAQINVSCEACHGPGEHHIGYISRGQHLSPEKVEGSFLYQVPGIDKKKQVEDCARCHSRRGQITNDYVHGDELMDHYVPSMINRGLYHTDGQILDEVYVYGSFLQSKMYRRNVGCKDCHNVHSLELKFEGNALCTQCHVKEKYDDKDHHFHPVGSESSQCVNCHMPGKVYMGNDFRRDHSFRVPRPDLSAMHGTPNACIQCHTDQTDQWAADKVKDWYGNERPKHFSPVLTAIYAGDETIMPEMIAMVSDTSYPHIIRATVTNFLGDINDNEAIEKLISALKDDEPLMRYAAVSAFGNASPDDRVRYLSPLLEDSVRAVRTHASYMLADLSPTLFSGSLEEAYNLAKLEFEKSLDVQADFPTGQLLRGQYYQKTGNNELAKKAYSEAMQLDPYLPQPHFAMANIIYREGDQHGAIESFAKAIQLDSTYVDAYYSLGLLMAEVQNLDEAEINLKQAAVLSGNPRYYYNWGLTLQNLQKPDEAELAFMRGLEIQPSSEAILNALAILYIQQQNKSKARIILENLLQINPQNPEYQNMRRMVQ